MFRLYKITGKFSSSILKKTKTTAANLRDFNKYFINVRVTPNDYVDVLRLFWTSFTTSEPCFIAARLSRKYNPVMEEIIMDVLSQGSSIMSVCRRSGEIVGASINGSATEWDLELSRKLADICLCKDTANLLRFYSHISIAPRLFEKYKQCHIFEVAYLMVQKNYRGNGIGYNLLNSSRDICKNLNYPLMRVDCTSAISAKLCEKMGFELEWEMPYSDYKKSDGKPLYLPPKPHTSVKVYIHFPKRLPISLNHLENSMSRYASLRN